MSKPLFEAKGISKDYPLEHTQRLHVLEKIDIALYPKEIVAVIGPSGCGKSTLIRILAGLIPASEGQISYHGKKLSGLMPGMSMVFQTFALYPWLTVRQNIDIVLKSAHVSAPEMRQRTNDAIKLIGLEGFEEAYPRELSGGMKQRVGMARALVRKPAMLFMDEPFSEVDAFTAEVLRTEILKIWADPNINLSSILLISHDIREVATMADRIIVLGMNPATVRTIIENKLPRPRNSRSPEFLKLVDELHDSYGAFQPLPPSQPETTGPLLHANRDDILGLLTHLSWRGGTQDIFKIGAESSLHFDKVTLVLEAAELLNFIELKHRTATLTETGKDFLSAPEETRRKIWKEQLLTIPLFLKTVDLLKQDPNQSLGQDALLQFLSRELPRQDASVQLHILIRWGSYGNLFTFHRKDRYLSLNR